VRLQPEGPGEFLLGAAVFGPGCGVPGGHPLRLADAEDALPHQNLEGAGVPAAGFVEELPGLPELLRGIAAEQEEMARPLKLRDSQPLGRILGLGLVLQRGFRVLDRGAETGRLAGVESAPPEPGLREAAVEPDRL